MFKPIYWACDMARVTVKAMKDPRVAPPPRISADAWPHSILALSPFESETLVAVIRTLCPHDWLDDAPYRDATFAMANDLLADPQTLTIMRDGLAALETHKFAALTEAQRAVLLTERETTLFFRFCLVGAVRYLYDLPEVWAGCGYEGAYGCFDNASARPLLG
jgi:hypothetical protein